MIVSILIGYVIGYLSMSFVDLDMKLFNWSSEKRAFFLLLGMLISGLVMVFMYPNGTRTINLFF